LETSLLHLQFWGCEEDDRPGVPIQLKEGKKQRWIAHPGPDVDLACLPLQLTREQVGEHKVPAIRLGDVVSPKDIYEGAPIMLLGYPEIGLHALRRAVVRQGIISCIAASKPETDLLWIDSHVFPGNSGGPVFRLPCGIDAHGHCVVAGKVAFLGIVTQARLQQFPLMAREKQIEFRFRGHKRGESLLAPDFVGIGVVEPAGFVKEVLTFAGQSQKRGTHKGQDDHVNVMSNSISKRTRNRAKP
jgi:hypothetical protein